MKECSGKKCLLSFLAVYAFMLSYEIFEHSILLARLYKASATVWRPVTDMDHLSTWYLVHTALLALLFCVLYKGYSCNVSEKNMADSKYCPFKQSIPYGIKIGLIMGVLASRSYTWIPMHMNVAMAWFFGGLAEGVGIGLMLGLTSRKKTGNCGDKTGSCGS